MCSNGIPISFHIYLIVESMLNIFVYFILRYLTSGTDHLPIAIWISWLHVDFVVVVGRMVTIIKQSWKSISQMQIFKTKCSLD